jgi:hypothetical protein
MDVGKNNHHHTFLHNHRSPDASSGAGKIALLSSPSQTPYNVQCRAFSMDVVMIVILPSTVCPLIAKRISIVFGGGGLTV